MEQRDYTWSTIFAWGLTLSGAALATGGVVGMFWPQMNIGWICISAFAAMMAFGIGLVNCSAAGALHAVKHRKADGTQVDWTVLAPALAVCLGFAFATNIGVHLGWEIVKANAPAGAKLPPSATINIVFYIFAFAKPAMAWIVEGRKAMDAESRAMLQAQRRAEAQKMAETEAVKAQAVAQTATAEAQTAVAVKVSVEAEADKAGAEAIAETVREKRTKARSKPKTEEEKREAAMRAAARRAAEFRAPAVQARVLDLEGARRDQPLSAEQISRAIELVKKSGKKPSVRLVAEVLSVPRERVERSWPKDAPRDETRAA
jgi:hypothetical protein